MPLLIPTANNLNKVGDGQDLWTLNFDSKSGAHLDMFKFLGALMGLAFRVGKYINIKFPSILWKSFTKDQVTIADFSSMDTHEAAQLVEFQQLKEKVNNAMDVDIHFLIYFKYQIYRLL